MEHDIKGKKILVVVPHQDDEINIAGGLIYTLRKENQIFVMYTTNGDYCVDATIRYNETVKACRTLGVKKQNIVMLGYPDTSYKDNLHMYTSKEPYVSVINRDQTYGGRAFRDYSFCRDGIHKKYLAESMITDVENYLLDNRPDIIICVDLDFHPDHIATSLCCEKAIGRILNKKNNDYCPDVLKTFAYENAYFGPDDFNERRNRKMIFDVNKEGRLTHNPYYNLSEAVEFQIKKICYSKILFINPIWRAINKHKSQLFVNYAFRVMNANNVYWRRDTHNLIHQANVTVSSSDPSFLSDFIINDSGYILHGDRERIIFDKSIWIPDKHDDAKMITISLNTKEYVKELKLYLGNNGQRLVERVRITIDGDSQEINIGSFVEIVKIKKRIKKITIKILDKDVRNGFSEIEIIGEDKPTLIKPNCEVLLPESGNRIIFFLNRTYLKYKVLETKIIRKMLLRKK